MRSRAKWLDPVEEIGPFTSVPFIEEYGLRVRNGIQGKRIEPWGWAHRESMGTSTNVDKGRREWRGPIAYERNGKYRVRWQNKGRKGDVTSKGLTQ